jgi:hypothetical protein
MSPNPAKAPWYFMGIQELLVHLHPAFGAVVVPLLALGLLLLLPALGGAERPSGRWFGSAQGARLALAAAALAAVVTLAAVIANEPLRQGRTWFPGLPAAVRGGVLPLAVAAILVAGVAWASRRRGGSRLEVVQAAFTFVVASFVVLTVVGVFFRGQGMALVMP